MSLIQQALEKARQEAEVKAAAAAAPGPTPALESAPAEALQAQPALEEKIKKEIIREEVEFESFPRKRESSSPLKTIGDDKKPRRKWRSFFSNFSLGSYLAGVLIVAGVAGFVVMGSIVIFSYWPESKSRVAEWEKAMAEMNSTAPVAAAEQAEAASEAEVQEPAEPPVPQIPALTLSGITIAGAEKLAIINNKVLMEGDTVQDGIMVKTILGRHVILDSAFGDIKLDL